MLTGVPSFTGKRDALIADHAANDGRTSIGERVLVLAPTGRDGELISEMLDAEGTALHGVRARWTNWPVAVEEGAAMALFAEEALIGVSLERLIDALERQPSWSDFPLLFLTSAGQEASATSTRLLRAVRRERQHHAAGTPGASADAAQQHPLGAAGAAAAVSRSRDYLEERSTQR